MFFIGDVGAIEFKRRRGKDKRKRKQRYDYQQEPEVDNYQKREQARKIAGTSLSASRELRGWMKIASMFM